MSSLVKVFNQDNFKAEVLAADKPVLVDFWAPWCGPCRMFSPIIEELAQDYAEEAIVGKVNVDENRDLAAEYGVLSIPNLLVLQKGQVVEQLMGARPKTELMRVLNRWLEG
ncbi:MAG: thioredoxin [Syntrophomonadaceae bacterium]|nr:thioredoxin [Syntrophomonadaceae bacterium]